MGGLLFETLFEALKLKHNFIGSLQVSLLSRLHTWKINCLLEFQFLHLQRRVHSLAVLKARFTPKATHATHKTSRHPCFLAVASLE